MRGSSAYRSPASAARHGRQFSSSRTSRDTSGSGEAPDRPHLARFWLEQAADELGPPTPKMRARARREEARRRHGGGYGSELAGGLWVTTKHETSPSRPLPPHAPIELS